MKVEKREREVTYLVEMTDDERADLRVALYWARKGDILTENYKERLAKLWADLDV